ncbi:MAG: hypothetical protein IK045_08045 [Bacteroidales bacterium]|nr:hypothetical protein [Bacteroidales bacterium]
MKRAIILALSLLAVFSCSIKEDRAGCPCSLTVVLVEAGGPDGEDLVLGISGLPDERLSGARIPERVERTVLKGVHKVTAFSGDEGMILSDGVLSVPYGEACGPLMARSESIECLKDEAVDTVRLRKQHIVLTFRADASCAGIVVRSQWNGLSVKDLQPAAGRCRARASRTAPGEFKVLLPRQGDASMVADILGGDGAVAQTLEVGAMLEKAGYDFAAPSLDDAIICLDPAPDGTFSVTVEEWENSPGKELNI